MGILSAINNAEFRSDPEVFPKFNKELLLQVHGFDMNWT